MSLSTDPPTPRITGPRLLLFVGFALAALNLRPALVGVSPLLPDIMADLELSPAGGGLISTIMVVCLGVGAPLAPLLALRIGVERVLLSGLLVLSLGLVVRSMDGPVALYSGAAACGLAMAVMNVVMPAITKRYFPQRAGLVTGIYTSLLMLGAASAAGLTVPVTTATGTGWQVGAALWLVFSIPAVLCWAPQALGAARGGLPPLRMRALLGSRVTWVVTAFMGLQSLTFNIVLAWVPTIYQDAGLSPERAGYLLAVFSLVQMITAIPAPVLAARARSQVPHVVTVTVLTTVGYLGLLLAPMAAPWLWIVFLGLGMGAALSLALLLITMRAPDSDSVVSLSAVAQCFGYLLAAIGPVMIGWLYQSSGGWTVPLLTGLGVCAAQLCAGILAGRPGIVQAGTRR